MSRLRRIRDRVAGPRPFAFSCCWCFCSNPAHKAEWEADSLVLGATSPKSPYSCQDVTPTSGTVLYRFVACSGGSAAPCTGLGDLIPDEQQQLPHEGIKGCTGVVSSYKRYPNCGHSLCGSALCGRTDTLAWLKSQGW